MNKMFKRNRKYLLFTLFIIVIGLILGLLYYYFLNENLQNNIIETINNYHNFHYNFILKDLITMSILIVTSFFIIGLPFSILYLLYESFALGFIINLFFITFNSNLTHVFLFIIINKLLSFIIKIIFLKKTINISRYVIGLFIYKQDEGLKRRIIINFKNTLYLLVITLTLNIILYFISFLIK